MIRLKLGAWVLDVDRDSTTQYYKSLPLLTEACGCNYCRNFLQVIPQLQEETRGFFDQLGIDLTKEGEVYELTANEDGSFSYGGFYHIAANIVQSPSTEQLDPTISVGPFRIWFTTQLQLVPNRFPSPTLQPEFEARVPWVLAEQPNTGSLE
ncbi:MAG: hypothetical protein ACM3QW_07180 [Ignavibacteriales bacterium]